jgi:hypothetical protein
MFRPLVLVALAALAAPATAQDQAFPYGTARGWTVEALRDAAGFTGCAGRIDQRAGRLVIGWRIDSWFVTVPADQTEGFRGGVLRFDMGDPVDVEYGFAPDFTATAAFADSLVRRIDGASELRTRINGVPPMDWSLEGSAAMTALVTECVSRLGKPPG